LPAALFNLTVGAYSVRELVNEMETAGFREVRLVAYNDRRRAGLVTAIQA